MFGFGMPELIVIFIIVVVVFGASRLPELGSSLGQSIKNFKKGFEDKEPVELNSKTSDDEATKKS